MLVSTLSGSLFLAAQESTKQDSIYIIQLNQEIDNKVVKRDIESLDSFYATDFKMTHGDGRLDTKTTWLAAIGKSNYSMRHHDSVKVELHSTIAIVRGSMFVQKNGGATTTVPFRNYFRVFIFRNNYWQLLSHVTIY